VDQQKIGLVVMATHGRTGLRHILMGSVAETVVRHSAVPVLTIKPSLLRESVIRNEDIENELHLP
jgi:nucleotide-binding universal stress UspA family protein